LLSVDQQSEQFNHQGNPSQLGIVRFDMSFVVGTKIPGFDLVVLGPEFSYIDPNVSTLDS